MANPVEVVVDREKIDQWSNTITVLNYVMRKLREGGAPVNDGLFPATIGSGRIVMEQGMFDELIVRWEP